MSIYPVHFWFLIIVEALMAAGYAVSFPFLAVYLTSQKSISMTFVGFYLSFSMFLSSLANFYGGELSDKFGRKKIMFFSLFGRSLIVFLIAIVIKYDMYIFLLFILHPIGLFFGSFFNPSARAYVADLIEAKKRLNAYSIMRIGTNSGWAIGPAIGGMVALKSYANMFFITAAIYFICSVLLFFLLKEIGFKSNKGENKFSFSLDLKIMKQLYRDKVYLYLCIFTFTIAMVMSQLVVPVSMYSKKYLFFNEHQIGLLFTLNGLMVVFLQYFVSNFLSRYPINFSVAIGAFLYAVGYLMFGFSVFYSMAILSIIVVTFGELSLSPGIQTMAANIAPENKKGRYIGAHTMIQQAGNSAGIFIGSFLMDNLSIYLKQISWFCMFLIGMISFYGFLKFPKVIEGGEIEEAEKNLI
jgi:MFS family permease